MDTKTIDEIIKQHEKFRNSYFWSPPSSSSARRSYEKRYSRDDVVFDHDGKHYEISQTVSCSCRDIYYRFSVHVDGIKKTIRALKKLVS